MTRRSVIVGPHGSGKSTLLHALQKQLIQANPASYDADHLIRVTLRQGESHGEVWSGLSRCPAGGLLMLDGSEQLSFLERLWLMAVARSRKISLLLTSHRPLLGFLEIYRTRPQEEVARRLAETLLVDFPQLQTEMMREFDRQWPACQGNVRQLWATLYDHFEKQNIPTREG
jgi:energy-coupling factor transporter ATP-binding protein EcfA2